MVVVLGNNEYMISEIDGSIKVLTLGRKHYVWEKTKEGHDRLTRIKHPKGTSKKLERGNYWLFNVISDTRFTPGVHLSLACENCKWKAFIISGNFQLKTGESCVLKPTSERIARPQKSQLSQQAYA